MSNEEQGTINITDPATYAKNIDALKTLSSPSFEASSLTNEAENSTSVKSEMPDKEEEQQRKEVPAEAVAPKRRGWWQRGKLF